MSAQGPTLYLHIGMPKTGTSLIQAVLNAMRPQLLSAGTWLPARMMANHRIAVEASAPGSLLHSRADAQHIRDAMTFEAAVEQLRPRDGEWERVLVSSEYFSEVEPERIKAILESAGFDAAQVRVVAALRRQDRILVSGFNQDVKALDRTQILRWDLRASERLDWYARLQPWSEAFGVEAITVQVFDREAAAKRSLTSQFLDTCGIASDPAVVADLEQEHRQGENVSLPATLLAFKLAANHVVKPGEIDWLMDEALRRGVGEGVFGLDDDTVRAILDHFRESNRRVAREFLGEDGDLFDETIQSATHTSLTPDNTVVAQMVALSASRLSQENRATTPS